MQSLVLPPSFVPADFGHLRFPGPERHLLRSPRSANARRYTPRDFSLPSMSSTVPADDPLETLGNVRRPGHPELPKPVTTTVTSAGAAVTSAVPRVIPSTLPDHVTAREPALPRYVTGPSDEALRQPLHYSDTFSSSRIPPTFTGQPTAGPSTVTYPPAFGAGITGVPRTLPQKTTRRTKAHVASACVNCKKKHLGCDPARPCRRCVLSGKADTCVDVTHKKRGRPPLKADEGSIRTYATQMDHRGAPTDPGQARRPMHRTTSSRELRPMTDLQIQQQPGMMGGRLPPGQPQRWPVVYPHTIDPSLTTQRAIGHRRFSSSGSTQSLASVSPTGYAPIPTGYNPALAAGRMPPGVGVGVGRPIPYPSPGMHPTPSPPQYQHYGVPISSYPENPRVMNRMPMGEAAVPAPRDPREGYAESPVRLPPIYSSPIPNPQPPPQAYRVSDSYPGTWSPPPQQAQDLRQRGFIEPISPNNLMRQAQATADDAQSIQNPLVDEFSLEGQARLAATRSYDDQREQAHETDESDSSRPAKRRKMALENMVND
ncbi:putative C6 transcription factor [Aspergillus mulundensis]|uniref:Transcription activator of gluconeogenesis acuK n=1 Tax=Aspergillus mulundensis TaxID=1810919 RepID=A0A3D8R904_9EURO|nr:putative Zn(II)2Cys6 transcription factor [Aspergillus mulundensis]RDW70466.1 putative Zn(II)2Cys6 transcription factor [Aspergillus mulundensis]